MPGREVMECQQLVTVLEQVRDGFRIFCLKGFNEQIEGSMRILARLGLPDIVQHSPNGS